MELRLEREPSADGATMGRLFVGPTLFAYTLEDETRAPGVKIPGETCIPPGRYKVIVNMSRRFGQRMPLVLGVEQFTGIRIHPGNSARDTSGCILVGLGRKDAALTNSKLAFERLLARIEHALKTEDVFITIVQQPSEPKRIA